MFNNKSELNVRYNFRILNLFYVFLFFKLLSGEMKNTHNSFNSGNLEPSAWLLCIVLYCGRVPMVNPPPRCTAAEGLLYEPWSSVVPTCAARCLHQRP